MKNKSLFLSAILLTVGCLGLWAGVLSKEKVEYPPIENRIGEQTLSYRIRGFELKENYPTWTPISKTEAPVSTSRAIKLAKDEISERLNPKHGLLFKEIKLTSFPLSELWFYVVSVAYLDRKDKAIDLLNKIESNQAGDDNSE